MRAVLGFMLAAVLVGCGDESAQGPQLPPVNIEGATFFDDFNRADTPPGDLGGNYQGLTYDMRGRYVDGFPLPPVADGYIKGVRFTATGDNIVYATQRLRGKVRRVGAAGEWRPLYRGAIDSTMVLAIAANANFISDMLHFTISREEWDLAIRSEGGPFIRLAHGRFSPELTERREYWFDLSVATDDQTITITVPGHRTSVADARVATLLGDFVFWEQYPNQLRPGNIFDFTSVWATEDGQPPVPASLYVLSNP